MKSSQQDSDTSLPDDWSAMTNAEACEAAMKWIQKAINSPTKEKFYTEVLINNKTWQELHVLSIQMRALAEIAIALYQTVRLEYLSRKIEAGGSLTIGEVVEAAVTVAEFTQES